MNNFSIFTICTENYKEAINFSVPSWLKFNNVVKIYIYTDFDLNYDDDRVVIINKINKTKDWLEVVGLKAILLKDFLENYSDNNFVFIDIDCYMVKDISDIFNEDFDIAVTRMFDKKSANSGIWFCKNNENIIKFSNDWINIQNRNKKNKIGIVKYNSSFSQKAFSEILHKEYKNKTYLKVLPVDVNKYNYERDDVDEWINNILKYNPYILHFKGRRWRNKDIVNKVFKHVH